jgi:hypothetical protein
MTSIRQPIEIDPEKTYPVVMGEWNGRIRELPGSFLLSSTNTKSYLYTPAGGGKRKVETAAGASINRCPHCGASIRLDLIA